MSLDPALEALPHAGLRYRLTSFCISHKRQDLDPLYFCDVIFSDSIIVIVNDSPEHKTYTGSDKY